MTIKPAILTLALAGSLALTRADEPEFFAMDTGTRDAIRNTPEEQAALVREVGFAGLAPTYHTPELLRETLDSGTFDVGNFLSKLAELGWHGPIGLQHYGIGGDARGNLQRSMTAWREMSRKVWPDAGEEKR